MFDCLIICSLFQVDEESSEILKRINPEDLGISVDVHGNQTVVVTSVQGKKNTLELDFFGNYHCIRNCSSVLPFFKSIHEPASQMLVDVASLI